MTEVCHNGHVRTDSNTTFVHDRSRNRIKRRCLDCRRNGKGSNYANELKTQEMLEKHEDIEDLIRFGATFEEIVQRSRYANWLQLSRSLREAGRSDLLERLRQRRGALPNRDLRLKDAPSRKKNGRRMHRQGNVHDLPKGVELY